MRPKEHILEEVRIEILDHLHPDLSPLWIQFRLIEVLLDIRDALVTDCKDAMNALIEIRGGEKHED